MTNINIKQIDAFTKEAFTGNPAAVVIDAQGLSDNLMQKIANEMNLSETAFVLPSEVADLRIRWFTTEKEVLFCGHATVATMHALAQEGRLSMTADADYDFDIETLVGIIKVKVSKKAEGIKVYLNSPQADLLKQDFFKEDLAKAIAIPEEYIADYPVMREQVLDYLYVGFNSLADLQSFDYNYASLKAFGAKHGIKGFVLFTLQTVDNDAQVHSRFFSPYYDVIEDPVTGSANGPLASYLVKNNLAELGLIKAEQGDLLGRPGRLEVLVSEDDEGQLQSQLIGEAVTVLEGQLLL